MKSRFFKEFFSEIDTIPPVLQNSYYPSLDGLRGVAIIMVVFYHLHLYWNVFYFAIFNGELGVLIFFVLSGFLITTLCIKEKVVTKDISLRNFYIRRFLRIVPVAYLFLFVLIILKIIFKLDVPYVGILAAALYLTDFSSYFRGRDFQTGHFWSLSVEEQFYLIIPFILKKNYKAYLIVILSIIFLLPLLIALQYQYRVLNNFVLIAFTHYFIKFQAIAVGCLFSVITFKYPFNINTTQKLITNIIAVIAILCMRYDNYFNVKDIFSSLLISFLIGYIIVTNIVPGKDFIFKFLNTRILKLVGVLSYSIYIWQQIFTNYDAHLPVFMVKFPYNLICIIIVSCLSYYFYERYFLSLKSKFSRIKRSNQVPLPEVSNIN
jgi:peptidoglycan/LPS O-acetylase OafA/YrhL